MATEQISIHDLKSATIPWKDKIKGISYLPTQQILAANYESG